MISLKDKVVIITGGGRGIGYGLSTAFAKAGAKLVITGRNTGATCQEFGDYVMQTLTKL